MDKLGKTIIRLVRDQGNQQLINIPGDVSRELDLKGGDAVVFQIVGSGFVVMSKVKPVEFEKFVARKV